MEFTKEDHEAISTAIRAAEQRTSGEIVCVLAHSSSAYVGVDRQRSRCLTPRARCIDNPRKVLHPTALRPNRYSLQTKLGITPYGDTLRRRGLLG
jgi:hypothetical protein